MGRSRHNKIYLGRRTLLLNTRRLQAAAGIGALMLLTTACFLLAK